MPTNTYKTRLFATCQTFFVVMLSALPVSCVADGMGEVVDADDDTGAIAVKQGTPSTFKWAGTLTTTKGGCTGTLIAPRVFLTAAHCIPSDGKVQNLDKVVLPLLEGRVTRNVGGFARYSDSRGVHDGTDSDGLIDFGDHDVALVILTSPVALDRYPSRSRASVVGQNAFGVGQITHSPAVPLRSSNVQDVEAFSNKYYVVRDDLLDGITESGDSGGPWLLEGKEKIIAVTSTSQLLGRVDPVACWIANKVKAFGGEGRQAEFGRIATLADYCR